jgi:hypothetical protein
MAPLEKLPGGKTFSEIFKTNVVHNDEKHWKIERIFKYSTKSLNFTKVPVSSEKSKSWLITYAFKNSIFAFDERIKFNSRN